MDGVQVKWISFDPSSAIAAVRPEPAAPTVAVVYSQGAAPPRSVKRRARASELR